MVRYHARVIWIFILLFALCSVDGAWASRPSDQLRDGIDRVFKILRDPALKGAENATHRRSAILKIAREIFDFGEMAKRSLGQHWDPRTPGERGEFVGLFTGLIQRSYLSKVDQHGSETMTIRGETVDGDHAVVRATLLLSNGGEVPLDYKMHSTSDRWRVYDLSIEGVSLVANYRAQFNKIVRTSSYEALVAKLTSRQASDFSAPSAAPSRGSAAR